MFIGRETELKFLNDKYNSDGGQLVVLYCSLKTVLMKR